MSQELEHSYFGRLVYDEKGRSFRGQLTDERVGTVEVTLLLSDSPDAAIETVLREFEVRLDASAEYLREAIGERDALIGAVVDDLLETYNESWRKFSQFRKDQGWVEVEREVLDERSFAAALRFTSFSLYLPTGPESEYAYDAWLDPGDLFWEHWIQVWRSDSGFHVSLFG